MTLIRRIADRFLGEKMRNTAELAKIMSTKEIIFKAPPFTDDLVKAIRLLGPRLRLKANEESRNLWQLDQNVSCWAEFQALSPILESIPRPSKVLELGPGFGRSVVFLTKKLGWHNTEFHLFEGNGRTTKYTMGGPRFQDSFCGNLTLLRQLLEFNGIYNFKIFDAEKLNFRIRNLEQRYDVIYSFYAVGFHWSLEYFFDDILSVMHDDSIAFFTVCYDFQEFEKLRQLHYRLIRTPRTSDNTLELLVMSKKNIFNTNRTSQAISV
jgi:hypothetical protein